MWAIYERYDIETSSDPLVVFTTRTLAEEWVAAYEADHKRRHGWKPEMVFTEVPVDVPYEAGYSSYERRVVDD